MKLLFTLFYIILTFACIAQPKNRPYYKVSPSVLLVKKSDPSPAIVAGFGGQLNRYATLGVIGGYFKLDGNKRGIIPIGIDLTVVDYGKKKIMPVFTMQAAFPIYEEVYRIGSSYVTVKGRFMIGANIGVSFPVNNKQKILLTIGYSQLVLRSNIKTQPRTIVDIIPIILTIML